VVFAPRGREAQHLHPAADNDKRRDHMLALLLVLLLIAVLFGIGFAVKWLWILAAIVLVLWLLGFVARGAEGSRWYRW
jgi:hypothetical protein